MSFYFRLKEWSPPWWIALWRFLIRPLLNERGVFEAGKGSKFFLDDITPTLQEISSFIMDVDFPQEVQALETTTLGLNDRTYIVGLRGATISLNGHWDGGASPAIDQHLGGILGSAVTQTFEYGPQGNTVGDVRYTGECILTSYGITGAVDGVVDWSAELTITGVVTRNTFT